MIEAPCLNGTSPDVEPRVSTKTCVPNPSVPESKDTSESYSSQTVPLKSSGSSMMNHEDTLEVPLTFSPLIVSLTGTSDKTEHILMFQMQFEVKDCVCL